MSEELIYKVAEEIYHRLDELKEQLVELKDNLNLIERDSIIRERILFRMVRDNANELFFYNYFEKKKKNMKSLEISHYLTD